MKSLRMLFAWAILGPAIAAGGEIRGVLTKDGVPFPNVRIEFSLTGNVFPATTNKDGAYRVVIPPRGECLVVVIIDAQRRSEPAKVYSVDRSVVYNLKLESANGKFVLKSR